MENKGKILIVEDNKSSATVLLYMLKTLGYVVCGVASSGETTLSILEKETPDLILMDIMIEGDIDGIDLALIVKKQYDIPVIFLSALSDDRSIQRAKGSTPYGYISKPFEVRDIKGTIEIALNKKSMEVKLRENELWFKSTLNSIGDAVIAVDGNNSITFINNIAEKMLALKSEDILNHDFNTVVNIIPDLSIEAILFYSAGKSNKNSQLLINKVLVNAEGKQYPVEESSSDIINDRGRVIGKVITIRDISSHREAQLAAIKAKDFYLSFFEKFPVLIWRANKEGLFNYFNAHWLDFTGVSIEEQIFTGWYQLIHPSERDAFITIFNSCIKLQKRIETEFRLQNSSGNYSWVVCIGEPFEDINTNYDGFIGVCFDISHRKQIEEELINARNISEAASLAKTTFISNMSHEIRTPLNGIMGLTDILLETNLDTEQSEYLGLIKQSSHTLLNLLNNLLNYSKIEHNKDTLIITEFELRHVVDEIVAPYYMQCKKRGIDFSCNFSDNLPLRIKSDSMKIQQVLSNLLNNANKFTEEGKINLTINSDNLPDIIDNKTNKIFIHFSVKDTGIGIKKEKHNKIFETFSQIDSSKTRRYSGSGLGLSLVKRMVEQMNGKVWFESDYGAGSCFHFVIEVETIKN